jgi:sterol 3beta-glucosyltransferase
MGSRGDCQPFVALALSLKEAGAQIRLYAQSEMEGICTPFLPLEDTCFLPATHVQTFLRDDPQMRQAMADGNFIKVFKAMVSESLSDDLIADARLLLSDVREFAPNLVCYNAVACMQGATVSEVLQIPSTLVAMQMSIEPSWIEPPPATFSADVARWLPGCLIRLCWLLLYRYLGRSPTFVAFEDRFRVGELGLPPMTRAQKDLLWYGKSPGCTGLVARSPVFSPPPPDWSEESRDRVVGAFVIDKRLQVGAWPPSDALRSFLDASEPNEPPIYIGWGSMIAGSSVAMLALAVRALMAVRRRAVILAGWASLRLDLFDDEQLPDATELRTYAADSVYFAAEGSLPHEWLFPQMAAIVHHGGAGTTDAALRSGIPSIITPVGFDQPEIAARVQLAGVGIKLAQLRQVRTEDLVRALNLVINDMPLRQRAAELGKVLREENGARSAAIHIIRRAGESMQQDVATCGGPLYASRRVAPDSRKERKARCNDMLLGSWMTADELE